MAFEFSAPEEFAGGGNFLESPGTFHMIVNDVKDTDKDGKLIDGFRVNMEVVDGTVRDANGCTEVGKTLSLTFYNGKINSKDGGKFSKQKQAAFFVASGVIGLAEAALIAAKQLRSVELERARHSQIVITLERREYENDKKEKKSTIDIHFANVFHVDDPQAGAFPKSAKHLALLPAERRLKPEQLQSIKDAFSGGASKSNANSSSKNAVTNDVTAGL